MPHSRSVQQTAGPGGPVAAQNGFIRVLRTGLLVLCVVVVTTAGACGRDDEPDGPPPSPSELSGSAFPEGASAVTTGVHATLGISVLGVSESGCYFFVRVAEDGFAQTWRSCGDSAVAAANKMERVPRIDETSDYGFSDDELIVRTVGWNWLAEAYELKEYLFVPCSATPGPPPVQDPGPLEYQVGEPWQLVEGELGAQVASDDSCWSVIRNVRWFGD